MLTEPKEAQQKQIDLPEDDPKIVDLVLQYLYKLDYNDDETSDATNKNNGTLDLNGFPSEETFPLAPSSIAAATEEQESIEDQVTRLDEPKIGKDQTLDLQKVGALPPAMLLLYPDEKDLSINSASNCIILLFPPLTFSKANEANSALPHRSTLVCWSILPSTLWLTDSTFLN